MMLDDSMKELLDEFIAESKEHLSTIEDDFLSLEQQKENPDSELVNKIFRAVHTIKGTSGFFGFEKITELAHAMENILSHVRSGKMPVTSDMIDTLLTGADHISNMVEDTLNSNLYDSGDVIDRLKNILESGTSPDDNKEMETTVKLKDSSGNETGFSIDIFTLRSIGDKYKYLYSIAFELIDLARYGKKSPMQLIKYVLDNGEIVDAHLTNVADDLRDGLPEGPLFYQILLATELSPSKLERKFKLGKEDYLRIDTGIESALAGSEEEAEAEEKEPEETVAEKPPAQEKKKEAVSQKTEKQPEPNQQKPAAESAAKTGTESVRISVDLLDNLMRLASELVLVRNQQLSTVDLSNATERANMQRLDVVTTELQETIMLTRMQPIGNIFNKFQRIVRDIAKNLGKKINISITGSEVELDKTILESLTDPLTHIIRNSCDHGIELPKERTEAGKPETGTIKLNAYHEGGQINIEIIDDGQGIDTERIKEKAVEKGLKTETELSQMSEKEILMLIMAPGFSTAKKVSDLSGRGVGMDVVKSGIEKLSGTVELESTFGKGTKLHLRLPLTLAIIPCLIITVQGRRYALPQVNLEELVCLYDEEALTNIETAGDREVYRLRNQLLPMVRLNEVLSHRRNFNREKRSEIAEKYRILNEERLEGINDNKKVGNVIVSDGEDGETLSLNFAVLRAGSKRFGLIVDNVVGTEEIVVKPMHPVLKSLDIYAGATVMGDGSVALILDVEGIARHSGVSTEHTSDITDIAAGDTDSDEDKQTILLFKSGEAEQFAVALPLIRRIERIAVKDVELIGGKEFITVDGISTRVLRLERVLDVSPCQVDEQAYLLLPKHIKRPYGILASSLVDIAETSFDLNTESYMDDGLLGTSVLRKNMTLFIDIYRLIELSEPDWFEDRRKETPPPEDLHKILLVEDSPFFRQLVKGYLEADGYHVTVANNGKSGFDKLKSGEFDLIVSDLQMPVMDGFEFIEAVRQDSDYSGMPAVALTALDTEEDKAHALKSGYDRFEVKIEREKFLTSVAKMLLETKEEQKEN